MLYLATASGQLVREAMLAGTLGLMTTPDSGYDLAALPGVPWAADNGCFSRRLEAPPWDADAWLTWLEAAGAHSARCLFAAVPDVVGDHPATLERWHRWAPSVAALGFRPAFVAQNGAENGGVPWGELDALFIGGAPECLRCGRLTTDSECCGAATVDRWKDGPAARRLGLTARELGKWVHMGRLNSRRRAMKAATFCDSADGTYLAFGPDVNLPRLERFLRRANEPTMFSSP